VESSSVGTAGSEMMVAHPMDARTRTAFLLLVAAQAAHSIEEAAGGLYEVFAPTRWLSGIVSDDPATGFIILNLAIVAFGLWCWAVPIGGHWPVARSLAWGWVVVEICNGINHAGIAMARGGYFPGVITAPLLLIAAGWLAVCLESSRPYARGLRS
jgi:hypothetical protein